MSPGRNDPGRERPPVPCLLNAQEKVSAVYSLRRNRATAPGSEARSTGAPSLGQRRRMARVARVASAAGAPGTGSGTQGPAEPREKHARRAEAQLPKAGRAGPPHLPPLAGGWTGQSCPSRTSWPGLRPSVGRSPSSARGCGELCARSSPSTRQGEKERA